MKIEIDQVYEGNTGHFKVTAGSDGNGWMMTKMGDPTWFARWSSFDIGLATLVEHKNGADIDQDKFTYAVGDDDAPEFWSGGQWRARRIVKGRDSFTRTPKVTYVDLEVTESNNRLAYESRHPDFAQQALHMALSDPDFLGYVYDGAELSPYPRRINPVSGSAARTPTHVRFSK